MPELRYYDKKYIYEPHKAPIADQRAWKCMITDNNELSSNSNGAEVKHDQSKHEEKMATYPKQMFDFDERRKICIDELKHAYDVKMYGDDKRVMNGEWRTIFGYPSPSESKDLKVKDETNGEPVEGERQGDRRTKGEKRDRPDGMIDTASQTRGKRSNEGEVQRGRGKQRKIDTMVSRKRGKM